MIGGGLDRAVTLPWAVAAGRLHRVGDDRVGAAQRRGTRAWASRIRSGADGRGHEEQEGGIERYRELAIRLHAPTAIEPRQACGRRCRSGQRARGGIDPIDWICVGPRRGYWRWPSISRGWRRCGCAAGARPPQPVRDAVELAVLEARAGERETQRPEAAQPARFTSRSRSRHDHGGGHVHVHVNDHGGDHVHGRVNVGVTAPVAVAVHVHGNATVGVAAPVNASARAADQPQPHPQRPRRAQSPAAVRPPPRQPRSTPPPSTAPSPPTAPCTSAANLPSPSAATSPSPARCWTAG